MFSSRAPQSGFSLIVTLAGGTLLSSVAIAADPADIQQLLQTNSCENCDLSEANLRGLDLQNAQLQGANLQGAWLNFSDLSRANLRQANLQGAEISGTIFQGANLQEADLTDAIVTNVCSTLSEETDWFLASDCVALDLLQTLGTELCDPIYNINGINPDFDEWLENCPTDLEVYAYLLYGYPADLSSLQLGVDLLGANLTAARLTRVDLSGADLRYAQLAQTVLTDTRLDQALLWNANVADVQNADFDAALMTQADVRSMLIGLYEQREIESQQNQAQSTLGAMNRSQQAYYLEQDEFARDLTLLQVGISQNIDGYRYGVAQIADDHVINRAVPLQDSLVAYMGIVYLTTLENGEVVSAPLLCAAEPDNPSPDTAITFVPHTQDTIAAKCPNGWRTLEP
ncbi:MAG: pentapeptide repeat-containing protein [Cyanobacteria bacterium P01_H01_bin.119]